MKGLVKSDFSRLKSDSLFSKKEMKDNMKKLMFVTLALAACSSFAEMKFGTVEMLKLVRNHPNYDSNKALLESTDKDYKKKLDSIKEEGEKLQTEGKKLVDQLRNPMLAQKAKADLEKQVTDVQQKLMGIEQRYRSEGLRCRQDLQDLEGRLLKTTTDDLRKRINAYAGTHGYDFIFDATAVPFGKKSYDVTDELLKTMGVDPAKAKGKEDESK